MKADDSQHSTRPSGQTDLRPWLILALWFLWLAALIYLARDEWNPRMLDDRPENIHRRDSLPQRSDN